MKGEGHSRRRRRHGFVDDQTVSETTCVMLPRRQLTEGAATLALMPTAALEAHGPTAVEGGERCHGEGQAPQEAAHVQWGQNQMYTYHHIMNRSYIKCILNNAIGISQLDEQDAVDNVSVAHFIEHWTILFMQSCYTDRFLDQNR